jgi:hypothetical protein
MGKISNILKKLNIEKENVVTKLTEVPPKEKVTPQTQALEEGATAQADTLFLPNDNGFKYCLVVVDIATRKMDCEPMKTKSAEETKKAFQKILKRKILKEPNRLEVDEGTEFKGAFYKALHNEIGFLVKLAGRHRSQSVVESKNYILGKILNAKMLEDEVANEQTSRHWVKILPQVVRLINSEYARDKNNPVVSKPDEPLKIDKTNNEIISIGTKVRVKLDNPVDFENNKLHGKFRAGDIRWSREIHKITDFYLRPGYPVMYQLDENMKVAYTSYQLQKVDESNEITPKPNENKKYQVEKILKKIVKNRKIFYKVQWKGYDETTIEPRSVLIQDVPELIQDFERKK